jgi:hypothetical protein
VARNDRAHFGVSSPGFTDLNDRAHFGRISQGTTVGRSVPAPASTSRAAAVSHGGTWESEPPLRSHSALSRAMGSSVCADEASGTSDEARSLCGCPPNQRLARPGQAAPGGRAPPTRRRLIPASVAKAKPGAVPARRRPVLLGSFLPHYWGRRAASRSAVNAFGITVPFKPGPTGRRLRPRSA